MATKKPNPFAKMPADGKKCSPCDAPKGKTAGKPAKTSGFVPFKKGGK